MCHVKIGKTATAWAELEQSLRLARDQNRDDRIALAEEQLALLMPRISRLTIRVEVAATQRPQVFRDGVLLGPAAWGEAIPVDPGDHVIRIEATGHATRVQSLTIQGDGASEVFRIEPLEPVATAPTPNGSGHTARSWSFEERDPPNDRLCGPEAPVAFSPRPPSSSAGSLSMPIGALMTDALRVAVVAMLPTWVTARRDSPTRQRSSASSA